MNKRLLLSILTTFLLCAPTLSAQEQVFPQATGYSPVTTNVEESSDLILPQDNFLLPVFGEDHAYTVNYRGNGEAAVNMRVAFSNFGDSPLETVHLQGNENAPTDIAVFQIIKEKVCIEYDYSSKYNPNSGAQNCLKYGDPNYYEYWGNNNKYLRADVQVDGKNIVITLPEHILPGKSGSYVLFMRLPSATKKVFGGAYEYRFETLKVNSPIRSVAIGFLTDSEMIFKGAESQVYYHQGVPASMMESVIVSKRSTFESADFDNYVSQIGQGQLYKNTSDLAPNDSYTVSGLYGKSAVNLYLKEALSILGTIIGFFLLVIGVIFILGKRRKGSNTPKAPFSHTKLIILALSASFVSGLAIGGYTILLVWLTKMIESMYFGYNLILILVISIFSFGVYSLLIFGPTIFFWIKRGFKWGLLVFGVTVIWIVIMIAIIGGYIVLSNAKNNSSDQNTPIPMMRGVPPENLPQPMMLEK